MNCRYVQSRLSAYVDVELSGHEQQQIRAHLEQCLVCSCEYENLRKTKLLLRQLPTVVPPKAPDIVWNSLRQHSQPPKRPLIRFGWHGRSWWQVAGGVAAVSALFWWSQLPESSAIEVRIPRSSPSLTVSQTFNPKPSSTPLFSPQTSPLLNHPLTPSQPPFSLISQPYPLSPQAEHPTFWGVSYGSGFHPAFGFYTR